ncbi:MAG: hypothetical protein NE327_18795, partial [Lentisphaeraceae bacterium]|nr:hypothetical protein [Lentisphaeraceae bacterium]
MKKIIFLISILFCLQASAQIKDYVNRIRLVEKFGDENNIPLGQISADELAKIMRFAGGLAASAADATIIQTEIGKLDTFINNLNGPAKAVNLPASIKNNLSAKAASILVDLINKNGKDPTPQNFLASQISLKRNIAFIVSELFKEIQKEATRPSRPVSPTSISLKRIFKRTTNVQKVRLPKASSGDYLSNAYMSLDYAYTEYDDRSIGNSGQFHDWGLSLHGTIFENTDLSFGLVANEGEANGSIANDFRSHTYGLDSLIHHKLNDNYSIGVFGFYQHTRYEKLDTKDYGAGFGFLFTTWHDLGIVELSTVNSWTKAYYEAGNDTLY